MLEKIKTGPEGKKLHDTLHNSKNIHAIRETTGYKNSAIEEDTDNARNGVGCGSLIDINPTYKYGGTDDTGSRERPPFIGLGHEMGHALEFDNGINIPADKNDPKIPGTTPPGEAGALEVENALRNEHNLPLRSFYY